MSDPATHHRPNEAADPEAGPPTPGTPQERSQARRADILISWQAACDQQITKLLVMAFVITLFYVYYGFVSPFLMKNRLQNYRDARDDIQIITKHFRNLRNRYIRLVRPLPSKRISGASDMGRFVDVIIPAVRERLARDGSAMSQKNDQLLKVLEDDMGRLTDLYNEHRERHGPVAMMDDDDKEETLRIQLRDFRRALGTVLSLTPGGEARPRGKDQGETTDPGEDDRNRDTAAASDLQSLLKGGGDLHLDVLNDPVNDLEQLKKLEGVITRLQKFNESEENISWCDAIRADFASASGAATQPDAESAAPQIRLEDNLMKSFQLYAEFAQHTPLSKISPLKFKPKRGPASDAGLDSYADIREFVGAPFEVQKLSHLNRLEHYIGSAIDQMEAEHRAPTLSVPFVNAQVDRSIVLAAVPIFAVVLFHILGSYVRRSCGLLCEINADQSNDLQTLDYWRYAPHNVMQPVSGAETLGDHLFARLATRARDSVGSFLMAGTVLLPLTITFIFFYNLKAWPWEEGFTLEQSVMMLGGLMSLFFMLAEVLMIWRQLREMARTQAYTRRDIWDGRTEKVRI